VAKKEEGCLRYWRWVAKLGDGWVSREMDGEKGSWLSKGDGWLSRDISG
jgi:hypothetical protein